MEAAQEASAVQSRTGRGRGGGDHCTPIVLLYCARGNKWTGGDEEECWKRSAAHCAQEEDTSYARGGAGQRRGHRDIQGMQQTDRQTDNTVCRLKIIWFRTEHKINWFL